MTNLKLAKCNGFTFQNGAWICPEEGIVHVDAVVDMSYAKINGNCQFAIISTSGTVVRFGGRPQTTLAFPVSGSGVFPVQKGDSIKIQGVSWTDETNLVSTGSDVGTTFCISYI